MIEQPTPRLSTRPQTRVRSVGIVPRHSGKTAHSVRNQASRARPRYHRSRFRHRGTRHGKLRHLPMSADINRGAAASFQQETQGEAAARQTCALPTMKASDETSLGRVLRNAPMAIARRGARSGRRMVARPCLFVGPAVRSEGWSGIHPPSVCRRMGAKPVARARSTRPLIGGRSPGVACNLRRQSRLCVPGVGAGKRDVVAFDGSGALEALARPVRDRPESLPVLPDLRDLRFKYSRALAVVTLLGFGHRPRQW